MSGLSSILKLSDLLKNVYAQLFGNSDAVEKYSVDSIKFPFLN